MPNADVSATPYEPEADQVDDWSAAIYTRLRVWAAAMEGSWGRWEPGYLLLTITSHRGQEIDPVMLNTADHELTVTLGYWETHLPDHAPLDGDAEDVAARDAQKLVEGWLGGKLRTAIYFDPSGKWCGSVSVEEDADVLDRLRHGLNFMPAGRPSRIELRTPRNDDWRHYEVKGQHIQEVGSSISLAP